MATGPAAIIALTAAANITLIVEAKPLGNSKPHSTCIDPFDLQNSPELTDPANRRSLPGDRRPAANAEPMNQNGEPEPRGPEAANRQPEPENQNRRTLNLQRRTTNQVPITPSDSHTLAPTYRSPPPRIGSNLRDVAAARAASRLLIRGASLAPEFFAAEESDMTRLLIAAITLATSTMFAAPAAAQDAKGAKVYADQKCSVCHAIAGKGNAKGPLDDVGSKLTAAEIHEWIVEPAAMTAKQKATRKPAMPAKYAALPKDDVDALVGYLASLKK
jgi:mono/diheme cytochrome c family protein